MQLKLPQLETEPENATVGQRPWIRAQVVTRIHWAWIQANPVRCVLRQSIHRSAGAEPPWQQAASAGYREPTLAPTRRRRERGGGDRDPR